MTTTTDDYCILILTYKRPHKVTTLKTLQKQHSTAATYLIVSDDDPTLDDYQATYPGQVIVYNREQAAEYTDSMDNFRPRKGIPYVRNATRRIAERLGYTKYIMLDDDYDVFAHRYRQNRKSMQATYPNLDAVFCAFFDYLDSTPLHCLCMAQNGDHIGGLSDKPYKRKAMNTFFLRTDRPYPFRGTLNEDVNAYIVNQAQGMPCLTVLDSVIGQGKTQANAGGLTGLYDSVGTYVKTFYSIIANPSACRISVLADNNSPHPRIHHECRQNNYAPCFVRTE